jgi:CBS domain-containing protein
MTVSDVMTRAPACTTAAMPLQEVARMMVDNNCGCIPVLDDLGSPVGVITDRDIVCRSVAVARDPLDMTVRDAMTPTCVTVAPDASLEHCCYLLESNQIRRAIVIDDNRRVIGIVAQADLARRSEVLGGELVSAVSKDSVRPSAVH